MSEQNKDIVFEKTGGEERYQSEVTADVRAELREQARQQVQERIAKEQAAESNIKVVSSLQEALRDGTIKSMNWGVIGWGQGGSRLAEQFYQFGYPVCVGNTAKQDLTFIDIPEENKLFIDFALGGVGKDLTLGEEAILEYQDDVRSLMEKTFSDEVDMIIVTIGGGGGSGSGAAVPLIQMVNDFGLPVIVLYTLPMANEGSVTKSNAIKTLDRIAQLAVNDQVHALVVIDNSRIEQIYPNVSEGNFWRIANFDIANTLNTFNTLSALDTRYTALDPMDFARILSSGNCVVYGKIEVPVNVGADGSVQMYEDELANAVIRNLENGLLAEGFDLGDTTRAGVIMTGREDILNQIPAVNINYAFAELQNITGDANLFRGIYKDDSAKNVLTVYSMFAGLGLPRDRVNQLIVEAEQEMEALAAKESDKKRKMNVMDIQQTSQETSRYEKMRSRNTSFGRLVNRKKRTRG